MEPKLMLLDEPTSALDPELVGEVVDVMKQLAQGGVKVIVVTHEMGFAREVADELVFMDDGAVVERRAPWEILSNPQEIRRRRSSPRSYEHPTKSLRDARGPRTA